MNWEDPIVQEVRKIRHKIAAEHHDDIRAIGRYYQQKQQQEMQKVVNLSIKKHEQGHR